MRACGAIETVVIGLMEEAAGRVVLEPSGGSWAKIADTLWAKRVGGARTRAIPMKRRKKAANNRTCLETASLAFPSRRTLDGSGEISYDQCLNYIKASWEYHKDGHHKIVHP